MKIFGPDIPTLNKLAEQTVAVLKSVKGSQDAITTLNAGVSISTSASIVCARAGSRSTWTTSPMRCGPRSRAGRWIAVAAGLLIAGCAEYQAAPITPAETAAALEARRLDDVRLRAFITSMTAPDRPVALREGWDLGGLTLAARLRAEQGNTALHYVRGIAARPINITGMARTAVAVNGQVPAPTLRWREGDTITLAVTNRLSEPTSIHWHGILLPNPMGGVPGHLHGMFSEIENAHGEYRPLKHTITVKPGERLSFLVTADAPGRWAFHCHLLYHMEAGMFQEARVA